MSIDSFVVILNFYHDLGSVAIGNNNQTGDRREKVY